MLGLVAEPASLDFTHDDGAAIPQALLVNVYEGLVKLDQDGEIVPLLASDWSVSDDGLTYTFDLVDDACSRTATRSRADDAVFSIERVKDDTAWLRPWPSPSDGRGRERRGGVADELVVTLTAPSNNWLYNMTTRIGAMFSEAGVDDLANTPVGTGPYEFTEWNRGDSIVLTRNDDYWGEAPYFERGDAALLRRPHRAEQRAAHRHDRRDHHGAGARGSGAVRGQRRPADHRGHDQRRGPAVVQPPQRAVPGHPGPAGHPARDRSPGAAGHLLGGSRSS